MEMKRREEDSVTVLEVRGNVRVGESSQQFAKELHEILEGTPGGVVIDVSGIDYVDSTGIGEMVGYLQKFGQVNRRLALLRPQQRLTSLLELTKLDTRFPIYHELSEALQFVAGE